MNFVPLILAFCVVTTTTFAQTNSSFFDPVKIPDIADAVMSSGGYMSGNDLYKHGKNSDLFIGYVMGIYDADRGAKARAVANYCVPDKVKSNQLSDVVYKYFEQNPQNRHESASYLVRTSFRNVWPC